jgi:hypothetical protein
MVTMRNLLAACAVFGMLGSVAFAGAPPKQNHHCKMADGSMDMAKTKKECKAAKGTWAKDAAEDAKAPEGKTGGAEPPAPTPPPAAK